MQIKKVILLFFLNLSILILPVAYAEANISKININTADSVTLEKLWGIGSKKAAAIIEFRDKNGMFESIDALKNVKGVGQKIIDENQGKMEVALIPEEISEDSDEENPNGETASSKNLGDKNSPEINEVIETTKVEEVTEEEK
ncbi:MAG: helix-hairpin-helix domain-containing protein [Proteobacteria bacterium]|nr:helix-hairpin-helix domain-containing protein [Pseudomonadota bacterium]